MDSIISRTTTTTSPAATTAATAAEILEAKAHCKFLIDHTLPSLSSSKISPCSNLTLHRLLTSELRFLSSNPNPNPNPISLNLGYLSSIISTIHHPSIHHISRVCKPLPCSSLHVDIVCTFDLSPAWFFVSDRNPVHLSSAAFRSRLLKIHAAARSAVSLKPDLLFFVFARGIGDDVAGCLMDEFAAEEVEFDGIGAGKVFEMKVGEEKVVVNQVCEGLEVGELGLELGDGDFVALVSEMRLDGELLVNFDTTALVAIVSGISNDDGWKLLKLTKQEEVKRRFKSNYDFVIAQVMVVMVVMLRELILLIIINYYEDKRVHTSP